MCNHPATAIQSSEDGTHWCLDCEVESAMKRMGELEKSLATFDVRSLPFLSGSLREQFDREAEEYYQLQSRVVRLDAYRLAQSMEAAGLSLPTLGIL